jgi:hypothetical protein
MYCKKSFTSNLLLAHSERSFFDAALKHPEKRGSNNNITKQEKDINEVLI